MDLIKLIIILIEKYYYALLTSIICYNVPENIPNLPFVALIDLPKKVLAKSIVTLF